MYKQLGDPWPRLDIAHTGGHTERSIRHDVATAHPLSYKSVAETSSSPQRIPPRSTHPGTKRAETTVDAPLTVLLSQPKPSG